MPARLSLCLLQQANGSFPLGDLPRAIGISRDKITTLLRSTCNESCGDKALEDVVFATLLAVAAMREVFPKQRATWELQEDKAFDISSSSLDLAFNPRSFKSGIEEEIKIMKSKNMI